MGGGRGRGVVTAACEGLEATLTRLCTLQRSDKRNDNDNHFLLLPHAIPHNVYIPICPTHAHTQ